MALLNDIKPVHVADLEIDDEDLWRVATNKGHALSAGLECVSLVSETLAKLRHHLQYCCFVVNDYDLGHILIRKLV